MAVHMPYVDQICIPSNIYSSKNMIHMSYTQLLRSTMITHQNWLSDHFEAGLTYFTAFFLTSRDFQLLNYL